MIPKLIVVPGRVLPGPNARYKNGTADLRSGSWNMQSFQFATRTRLSNWTYLWISSQRSGDVWHNPQELQSTLRKFQAKLNELGMEASAHTPGLRVSLSTTNVDAEIEAAVKRFVSHPTRKPPLILLVIIPDTSTSIYNRVKLACDVQMGLLNVCVVGSKFAKDRNDQYFANVIKVMRMRKAGACDT